MFRKLEKSIRHEVQAIKVRANLDEDRQKAKIALESAENSGREIDRLVSENNAKILQVEKQLTVVNQEKYDSPSVQQKLTQAQIQLQSAKQLLEKLVAAQTLIHQEVATVRTARGKVSPNNDEFETTKAKEIEKQAKEASQEAQNGVVRIQSTLATVKLNVIGPIQTAVDACVGLIKEIEQEELKYQKERNEVLGEEFGRVASELVATQKEKEDLAETLDNIRSGLNGVLNQFEATTPFSDENNNSEDLKKEGNNNNKRPDTQ